MFFVLWAVGAAIIFLTGSSVDWLADGYYFSSALASTKVFAYFEKLFRVVTGYSMTRLFIWGL